jgi:hypothetical protein
LPTEAAERRSEATVQALIRHGAAKLAIADCVGPHWQAMSLGAQEAAEMAEERQEVWAINRVSALKHKMAGKEVQRDEVRSMRGCKMHWTVKELAGRGDGSQTQSLVVFRGRH